MVRPRAASPRITSFTVIVAFAVKLTDFVAQLSAANLPVTVTGAVAV